MGMEPLKSIQEDHDSKITPSNADIETPILLYSYGNLYVLGKIWIQMLNKALVGTKMGMFPVVEAAAPKPEEVIPKKPAPMKYTDLPLYASPHYEYKNYMENIHKCPKENTKLLQEYLLPHVNSLRKYSQNTYCCIQCNLRVIKNEICESLKNTKKDLKRTMRDPDNIMIRRGVVTFGATTGYLLGSSRGIPRRIFFTGIGALTAGALCFPKETDEAFRTLTYHAAKAGLTFYNLLCGKGLMFRERLLCKEDLPPPPQLRNMNPSPKKEK